MKLFTIGPVEMFPETLAINAEQLPYFRTPEFSEIMLENEVLFRESICASRNDKVVFLTTSGTGAMEAAVINCFTSNDRLLVINGGSFGERFGEICRIHKLLYDEVHLPFGEKLTRENLEPYYKKGYKGLLVNLHETSTGQLYDIGMLAEFCRENDMYLIVDAIGAYGADEIDFKKYGIDVLIVSSQKALALAPGAAVVVISERIYRDKVTVTESGCLYLDFKQHIDNMERGQTPFTPAVGIFLSLNQRLKQIHNIGMKQMIKEVKELALKFRREAEEKGVKVPEYPLSNALTPIIAEPYAEELYLGLKAEYGLMVTPNGGELRQVLVRIGHLGNVRWEDYEELLEAMCEVKKRL
ncbi:aminotransferase class V-fold PLP-dependent enzyme [Lachnospiraceae bacterium 42-17]